VGSAGPDDDTLHQFPDPANQLLTTSPAPPDRGRFAGIGLPRLPDMFRTPYGVPKHSPTLARTWNRGGREALRISFQRRIEALQDVDRSVAATIRQLRAMRLLKRTVIIFASDNGYVVGEHNIAGKLWEYNNIDRIPMVIRGPGVPRGKVMRTIVTNPDVATTIAALARAHPTRAQDGVDFFPWLGAGYRVRVVPLIAWPVNDGRGRPAQFKGVRVGPWTYVRYHRGGEEMYDRTKDPYELYNLAVDPAYHAQLVELRKLTKRYVSCAGASCPKDFYAPPA
jgi:arylsulfatase A-like enzyme